MIHALLDWMPDAAKSVRVTYGRQRMLSDLITPVASAHDARMTTAAKGHRTAEYADRLCPIRFEAMKPT